MAATQYVFLNDHLWIDSPLLNIRLPYQDIADIHVVQGCPTGRTLEWVVPTESQAVFGPAVKLSLKRRLVYSRYVYLTPDHPDDWVKELRSRCHA